MLTAIVVGVATLGVALALVISIYRQYQTLDEDELVRKMQ
jgi:multicomponent Na+:H+ antiporter subunit C